MAEQAALDSAEKLEISRIKAREDISMVESEAAPAFSDL